MSKATADPKGKKPTASKKIKKNIPKTKTTTKGGKHMA